MANSYVNYTGNGSTQNFSTTFPFILKDNVRVTVDGVVPTYVWINATTVQITPAPAAGTLVKLKRMTADDALLVPFQNGAVVTENQLTTSALQALYLAQEASAAAGDVQTYVNAHAIRTADADLPSPAILPSIASRRDRVFVWGSNGDPIASSLTMAQLEAVRDSFNVPAGAAIAMSGRETPRITTPLVCTTMWGIKEVFQTPGGTTYTILLDRTPEVAPAGAYLRIDGWNGHSMMRHPLDIDGSWALNPGFNAQTFEVVGSVFDAAHMFLEGFCYDAAVPLVDASEQWNWMVTWSQAHGGGDIIAPAGLMPTRKQIFQSPGGAYVRGAGMRNTRFVLTDGTLHQPSVDAVKGCLILALDYQELGGGGIIGCSSMGNRAHQPKSGRHAVVFSGNDDRPNDLHFPVQYLVQDFMSSGSRGYGIKLPEYGTYDMVLRDVRVCVCNSDGFDEKNHANLNGRILFDNVKVHYWGMSEQTTNYAKVANLETNPFTTVNGSPQFTTKRKAYFPNGQPGQVLTISNGPTANGINFTGSFRCMAIGADSITFEGDVNATGSGVVGGAGVHAQLPAINVGDTGFDTRSPDCTIMPNCLSEGFLWARTGMRGRGAEPEDNNGEGSHRMRMSGRVIDRTPTWILATASKGSGNAFSCIGSDFLLEGPIFVGNGGQNGISLASDGRNLTVVTPIILDANSGFDIRGEGCEIIGGTVRDAAFRCATIQGSTSAAPVQLGIDPCTPHALGSNVVYVTAPGHPIVTTMTGIGFINTVNTDNGLLIERSNVDSYTGTKVDADTFSIPAVDLGAGATNVLAFGGEGVSVRFQAHDHTASKVRLNGVRFENTDPANTTPAVIIGQDTNGANFGQADDVQIMNCVNYGYKGRILDHGSNTTWGPANRGLPNDDDYRDVNEDRWTVIEEVTIPSGAPIQALYFNVGFNTGSLRLEMEGASHNNVAAQNLKLIMSPDKNVTFRDQNNDYVPFGTTSISSVMLATSANAGVLQACSVEFDNVNSARKPTRYRVAGGTEGVVATVEGGGYSSHLEKTTGFKIIAASGSIYGTFRLSRKGGVQ